MGKIFLKLVLDTFLFNEVEFVSMKRTTNSEKQKTAAAHFPKGHCASPRCKHEWLPRSEKKPMKCPKCGSINIYVE